MPQTGSVTSSSMALWVSRLGSRDNKGDLGAGEVCEHRLQYAGHVFLAFSRRQRTTWHLVLLFPIVIYVFDFVV